MYSLQQKGDPNVEDGVICDNDLNPAPLQEINYCLLGPFIFCPNKASRKLQLKFFWLGVLLLLPK